MGQLPLLWAMADRLLVAFFDNLLPSKRLLWRCTLSSRVNLVQSRSLVAGINVPVGMILKTELLKKLRLYVNSKNLAFYGIYKYAMNMFCCSFARSCRLTTWNTSKNENESQTASYCIRKCPLKLVAVAIQQDIYTILNVPLARYSLRYKK